MRLCVCVWLLLSITEQNYASCRKIKDNIRGHHVKWNKPDTKRKISIILDRRRREEEEGSCIGTTSVVGKEACLFPSHPAV